MDYKGKNNCQEQIQSQGYQVLRWCSEWPHPKPRATCSVSLRGLFPGGFSLLELCPFWLSGLCIEMGPKYQKTHIIHRLSSSSYWTTCWKEGEKENLDLLPLRRMGFQSQNIVQRSFSPLVFQLGSANPLRGHPGQRQERRSEQAKLQLRHSLYQPKELLLVS